MVDGRGNQSMASASEAKQNYERGILKFQEFLSRRNLSSWADAMNSFDDVVASGQLSPHDTTDATYKMGLLWLFDSNYEIALRYFERCLSINPRASFVHSAMGAVYPSLGNYEKSVWHHRWAMALGGDTAIGCVGVGRALLEAGDAAEAIRWFTKDPCGDSIRTPCCTRETPTERPER